MGRARTMTPLQLADAISRERAGRPDITAMSNDERTAAGLMTRRQAAGHERLVALPHPRLAERERVGRKRAPRKGGETDA